MARFVVHEHHASRLHFDLRLEMNGVFKSFAVPKGPSMNPSEKRLAIAVDDHALGYGDYEGIIPAGSYGAGAVVIWDRGEYDLRAGSIETGMLDVHFHGKKLKGGFALRRTKNAPDHWLWIKKKDDSADYAFTLELELTEKKRTLLQEIDPECAAS